MGMVLGKTGVAEPAYDVIFRSAKANVELRSYSTRFAIRTKCEADNKAFMSLAGYIGVTSSPQNSASAPIAMTAPVVKDGCDSTMSFILPEAFKSLEDVPRPTSPDVSVAEVPPAWGAVRAFSGWAPKEKAERERDALLEELRGRGLAREEGAKWELWQYNPPFTIPFLRRNEVWVEMTREECEDVKANFEKEEGGL
mmetsp:Transcript_19361/g.38688  ORF Transcript_19361/g.38688 Transcript_19361/m.38688 type:complete len:197 (+) Transcript_19361:315-905(+)